MKSTTEITNGTSDLTARQQCFVREYVIDMNASAAARRAGYSRRSAHVTGSRLLTNAKVGLAIASAIEAHAKATGLSAEWVLTRLRHEALHAESDAARVSALTTLAKHFGLLKERHQHRHDVCIKRIILPPGAVRSDLRALPDGTLERNGALADVDADLHGR